MLMLVSRNIGVHHVSPVADQVAEMIAALEVLGSKRLQVHDGVMLPVSQVSS